MVCLYHAARDVPSNAAIRELAQNATCTGRAGKNHLGFFNANGYCPPPERARPVKIGTPQRIA